MKTPTQRIYHSQKFRNTGFTEYEKRERKTRREEKQKIKTRATTTTQHKK